MHQLRFSKTLDRLQYRYRTQLMQPYKCAKICCKLWTKNTGCAGQKGRTNTETYLTARNFSNYRLLIPRAVTSRGSTYVAESDRVVGHHAGLLDDIEDVRVLLLDGVVPDAVFGLVGRRVQRHLLPHSDNR